VACSASLLRSRRLEERPEGESEPFRRAARLRPSPTARRLSARVRRILDGQACADGTGHLHKDLDASGQEHEIVIYRATPHSFFDRRFEEFKNECEDAWRRVLALLPTA
jgi:dienelactone hydrolase